jgi:hypothetical protein
MREKLNNNPLFQVGVLGVLLVAVGIFVMSSMGGGGKAEESAPAGSTESVTVTTPGETATATTAVAPPPPSLAAYAPPPPRVVTDAFAADRTVVLLFVRGGGIDDWKVSRMVHRLEGMSGVSTFVIPAKHIARYASITEGVELNRVPALVVLRPKRLDHGMNTAIVKYGYQSPESLAQAVVDAGYKGPTVDYHP